MNDAPMTKRRLLDLAASQPGARVISPTRETDPTRLHVAGLTDREAALLAIQKAMTLTTFPGSDGQHKRIAYQGQGATPQIFSLRCMTESTGIKGMKRRTRGWWVEHLDAQGHLLNEVASDVSTVPMCKRAIARFLLDTVFCPHCLYAVQRKGAPPPKRACPRCGGELVIP